MGFGYRDCCQAKGLHGDRCILFFETRKNAGTLPRDQYSYRTIESPSEGTYREKGSRFLAFAYPVTTEEAVKDHIQRLQKQYFDARHHCYAWMLGPEGKLFRAHDAGEPHHSAGDPILGQIRSKDLTDVLVVVVRYFGGVKLGVGGLINAYKSAAEDALNHAQVIEKEITDTIHITYSYAATPEVMRLVKEFDLHLVSQRFDAGCEMVAGYSLRNKEKLMEKLSLLKAMGTGIECN